MALKLFWKNTGAFSSQGFCNRITPSSWCAVTASPGAWRITYCRICKSTLSVLHKLYLLLQIYFFVWEMDFGEVPFECVSKCDRKLNSRLCLYVCIIISYEEFHWSSTGRYWYILIIIFIIWKRYIWYNMWCRSTPNLKVKQHIIW